MNERKRKRRKMPACDLSKLSDVQMNEFENMLTKYIDHACNARAAAGYACRNDEADCFKHNARYWRNGVGILRWVRAHFRRSRAAYERRQSAAESDGGGGDGGERGAVRDEPAAARV